MIDKELANFFKDQVKVYLEVTDRLDTIKIKKNGTRKI